MRLKFDDLTDHQRKVLFRVIDETKGRGHDWLGVSVFDGEHGGPLLFIRTLIYDGTGKLVIPRKYHKYHPDMTLLQHARANSFEIFTTMGNLQVLKDQGYLDLASKQDIEDPPGKLWKLLLSQKALDHYDLMHLPRGVRFLLWLWRQFTKLISFLRGVKGLAG